MSMLLILILFAFVALATWLGYAGYRALRKKDKAHGEPDVRQAQRMAEGSSDRIEQQPPGSSGRSEQQMAEGSSDRPEQQTPR